MFRPIRRKNKEISPEACRRLLASERRGVLALNGEDGYPYAVPINYLYCEEEGKIIFHGAAAGYKAEILRKDPQVCFTVYGNITVKEEPWAPYVQSVVIFGKCTLTESREENIRLLRKFAEKYYPDREETEKEVMTFGAAVQMFEIVIEHMSGKEIQEK